jgi:two-component system, NtrC family, response regulator AtoC
MPAQDVLPMLTATTLLVSNDSQLTRIVQTAHDSCDLLRLEICGPIAKAHSRLKRDDVVLVLLQLTADLDGTQVREFLREATACPRATTAIVCADEAAMREARGLLREGAADLLCLPADSGKLVRLLNDAARRGKPTPRQRAEHLQAAEPHQHAIEQAVSPGPCPRTRRAASQNATILLTGETGTGKTVLAREIHEASPRRGRPFWIVDCGALSAELIESEMFGHVKGAFTGATAERVGKFAAAEDGTLVLDEINSLPLSLQAKLLRAVEARVFERLGCNVSQPLRARIIAISNKPLEEEVARERFRADLFYRLNVIEFRLAPLRERRNEIMPLARKFLAEHEEAQKHGIIDFAPEAVAAFVGYDWPGNIRELKNAIDRASTLCLGSVISIADLPDGIGRPAGSREPIPALPPTPVPGGHRSPVEEAWRIQEALRKHGNVRARAARELGMSRVSFYKKLHKYGLFEQPS